MGKWHVVKFPNGRTISHRRELPGDAWCSVTFRDSGQWEWGVRVREPGDAIGTVRAHGVCETWQNARAAADHHAAALAATEEREVMVTVTHDESPFPVRDGIVIVGPDLPAFMPEDAATEERDD